MLSDFVHQNINQNNDDARDVKGKEYLSQKKQRRSKKDKTGRDFICGCGKEYLSYPALYIHLKSKHGGVAPPGTILNQNANSKRGRPKKNDSKLDDNRTIPDNKEFNLNFQPLKIDPTAALADYVEKNDLRMLKEYSYLGGSVEPTIGFPVVKFCDGDIPVYHPFHALIIELKGHSRNESLFTYNYCDYVFAKFLFSVSKIVNEKLYLVLGLFFRNLRECLNDLGYEKITEHFDKYYTEESKSVIPKRKEHKVFCEIETPDFLPIIADTFIVEYLPKYCPDFDQQLAVDLMYDFCSWLVKKKLTKIKTCFNNGNDAILVISDDEDDSKKANVAKKKTFGKLKTN